MNSDRKTHLVANIAVFFVIICCHSCYAKDTNYAFAALEVLPAFPGNQSKVDICLLYPMDYFSFRADESYMLLNYSHLDLCEKDLEEGDLTSRFDKTIFLLSANGNCSVAQNFKFVPGNQSGLIIISTQTYIINETYGLGLFGVIGPKTSRALNFSSADHLEVHVYDSGGLDGSTIVLGVLAVFCVIVGSFSGPYITIPGNVSSEPRILEGSDNQGEEQSDEISITVTTVIILVAFITIMLLLLYFFYNYLVYAIIALFCVAAPRGTYCILMQIISRLDCDITFPKIKGYGIHEIVLAGLCLSVAIVWFIFRDTSFSWILQDFLGICFCIHIIQTLRLPNLKICTALLSMLFIYDIFFVFITPLFTQNGKSIMVEVATGGGSDSESIPLLLKIPRLQRNPGSLCNPGQYSLLGFGDIIIPGFLVCFAHTYDIMTGAKYRPYFVSTTFGYAVGVLGAFVALYLMSTGQPALLYIVPAVLLAIFLVGVFRKEVRALWNGIVIHKGQLAANTVDCGDAGA